MRTLSLSPKLLSFGLMLMIAGVPAAAQSTEAEVAASLKGKPLYLRGMWLEDKLAFDADGKPATKYGSIPFTEAGFDFGKATLSGDRLKLEGQRIATGFDDKGRVKRLKLSAPGYSGHITLEVVATPGADFGKALHAIFAENLGDLTPALPSYWQGYALAHFLPAGVVTPVKLVKGMNQEAKEAGPAKIGGSVRPPKVLKSTEPTFTSVARALGFSGTVQVYLWVDENGLPSHLKVSRPVGLGLDEAALAAVQKYTFTPATQNGQPVKVDLYIDVNFQII